MSARPQPHTRTLASILVEAGVVSEAQVQAALERQRETGLRIGETLVEMGAATEEDIGWALARQLGLTFVEPQLEALDPQLTASFPPAMLRRLDAVPLVRDSGRLSIALADPLDPRVIAELERVSRCSLDITVATPSAIRKVLGEVFAAHGTGFDAPHEAADAPRGAEAAFLLEQLNEGIAGGADELHYVPAGGSVRIAHRVAGRLAETGSLDGDRLELLLSRLEALGGPQLAAGACHARGVLRCPMGAETLTLAVSLLRQPSGIALTLTLGSTSDVAPSLDALGLEPADVACLRAALDARAGLCIVTGPPGCGGTTTLAALLLELELGEKRVLAFGDVATLLPADAAVDASDTEAARGWREAAVGQHADVVALDGVLRGDDIRAALAPEAAGRLVAVRTDWLDSFALLEHLASDAAGRTALAARLRCVVQQRRIVTAPSDDRDAPAATVVHELLIADDSLRAAILAGRPAGALRAAASGFVGLGERIRLLAESGVITPEEAARAAA